MGNYIIPLIDEMRKNRNPEKAEPMEKYLKNRFILLGIQTPERKDIVKKYIKINGDPELDDLDSIIKLLWEQKEREFQYIGNNLADRMKKEVSVDTINLYKYMVINKSWWDTVDYTAGKLIGFQFEKYPDLVESVLPYFRNSNNMWLRRTAILFQLHYKERTNWKLLKCIINENLGSNEFFINKAIGWALREYSKTEPEEVHNFVKNTNLSSLSHREGLKWINSQ